MVEGLLIAVWYVRPVAVWDLGVSVAGRVQLLLLAVVLVSDEPVVVLSCAVSLILMGVALLARIPVGGSIAAVVVVLVVRESCVGVALLALRR